ncbi:MULTISPECIES: DNA polymerase III subunit alpha [Bacillaceae]|uniref:DNA polymerase III subunit alpha n=1 Tax=Evansella alkalicola TaxID=745819 RepID=A0ABS6JV65_9BACI|nr:DNA polymerase III subunit alpha [Litchfieldia alkalitelluris]MBU9721137.1 DNA polymerase III subunit alpha [Bacillus alkalicola]
MAFVHLHVHSEYSLLRSAGKISELVTEAKKHGSPALAITDIDAMYGVIPFYKSCLKNDIKPIIGVELGFSIEDSPDSKQVDRIVLLAENNEGYRSLITLTSKAHEKQGREGPFITSRELSEHKEGVILIIPFENGTIGRLLDARTLHQATSHFEWFQQTFGKENVFVEIQNHWRPEERERLLKMSEWAKGTGDIHFVVSNHVQFTRPEQRDAHKTIQAIRLGEKLNDLPTNVSSPEFYLKTEHEMKELFQSWQGAFENTLHIAERCHVELEFGNPILPHFPVPNDKDAVQYLRDQCVEGVYGRYTNPNQTVWDRLDYELDVINQMGYNDYFLIVADFMKYAHDNGILTGPGRGSAAGSIVAYVLKITDVDPIYFGLLFERFLNPERVSMPDIDIDFPDDRRDEVIQYVKGKYGKNHVAQIITFGTLAAKAAIRDVGRVLDIDLTVIDRITKKIPSRPNIKLKAAIEESPDLREMIKSDDNLKELFKIADHVEGLPRHSSVHAAGIVMSKSPLTHTVPLQEGNEGLSLTQYPMGDLEDLGLLKMDFLGLRNLSFINNILQMISKSQNKTVELQEIPFDDDRTFQLLGKGETSGVFQLESSGMKTVLRRLKPTEFEDIVAVNALYRPGPMENIPLYINRKHGKEAVSYPHSSLKEILEPTYGVLIYQEQIMQIASKMAGFSLGEADILRRAVGKKKRDVLEQVKEQFVTGAVKKGYSIEDADKVYYLIQRFADYGFNRSHAVAYSVIAYYLAYLKANYPLEFLCALMNSATHHQDKLGEYVAEARRQGITVLPPSILKSEAAFISRDGVIIMGLLPIKNVGMQAVKEIISERRIKPFESLFDLCARIPAKTLPKRAIDALIVAGALDDLHKDRAQLLASVEMAMEYGEKAFERISGTQTELFFEEETEPDYIDVPPLSEKDQLNFERQVLGFYASGHPIEPDLSFVEDYNRSTILDVKNMVDGNKMVRIAGMLEELKVIQTKKKQQMAFATVSDETGDMDITIFPSHFENYRLKLQKGALLFIEGKIQDHQGERKLILEKCTTMESLKGKKKEKSEPKLYLKISALQEKNGDLNKLKNIIQENPGSIRVILYYERTGKAIHLSEMWNVSIEEAVLLKIQGLLSKKNVFLKQQRV